MSTTLPTESPASTPNPAHVALLDAIIAQRRIPNSTYRIQFNKDFTFDDARKLVPYLRDLGIGDVYASPILKARPGSPHGYDICDHSQINPELGGEEAFAALAAELAANGMGLLLDIVPNHMGIGHPSNLWWMDVLENGAGSIYANHFDIDWSPVNPHLRDKVLLPCLGDQYGAVLESGQIRLAYEGGAFFLYYYETKLPVAPRTYPMVLQDVAQSAAKILGDEHDHVLELQSILTALGYLPDRSIRNPERRAERNREKEIIKKRIAALVCSSPEIQAALDHAIAAMNGTVGDRRSFDRLDQLLDMQPYRPAYWRVATEEINYRRFFDINDLAAIRTEIPQVFHATHALIFRLLAEGKVQGLRVDHPDGLWNPGDYFRRLQESYLCFRARKALGDRPDESLNGDATRGAVKGAAGVERSLQELAAERVRTLSKEERAGAAAWPLYVVAEKILGENEPLPQSWSVHGTSGYDYLNLVGGLFVDAGSAETFTTIYHRFIHQRLHFEDMAVSNQRMILRMSMSSELNALGHELDRISESNRRYRDFTLNSLTLAVREVIAAISIYRTYITGPGTVDMRDRRFILEAIATAKRENPRSAIAVFDFVRDTLLLDNLDEFREEDRRRVVDWVMHFQQLTGPVLAKAMEDTSFYIYNRLTSLNEVGGHPGAFGVSVKTFHDRNIDRLNYWPHSMLTTSTHDTKRSEDVRARITVLSEIPGDWQDALERWSGMNAGKKTLVDGRPAPDANDEYLLYQTLLGTFPDTFDHLADYRERILRYMEKATKEAKVHSSWLNPNNEYDTAMREFVVRLLPDDPADLFLIDFQAVLHRVAFFGMTNSVAQVVLKLTCPGVPDIYQGNELWDFSLVDPDNRRPVDFAARQRALAELRKAADLAGLCRDLLEHMDDGRAKLYVTFRVLELRRERGALFRCGQYVPLEVLGQKAEHVCAFARVHEGGAVIVVAPRLVVGLAGGKERHAIGEIWGDTRVVLPAEIGTAFRNCFTGEQVHADGALPVAEVLRDFPVAVLADPTRS